MSSSPGGVAVRQQDPASAAGTVSLAGYQFGVVQLITLGVVSQLVVVCVVGAMFVSSRRAAKKRYSSAPSSEKQ